MPKNSKGTDLKKQTCSVSAGTPCYTLDDALFDLVQIKHDVGCLGMRQITDPSWMAPQRMSNKQAKDKARSINYKVDRIIGVIENEIKER